MSLPDAVGYPATPKPLAPWAQRMKAAHYNAVENLVLFAALVLVAEQAAEQHPLCEVTAAAGAQHMQRRAAARLQLRRDETGHCTLTSSGGKGGTRIFELSVFCCFESAIRSCCLAP